MSNAQNTQSKIPTNNAEKRVGRLAHDAHIFDRTCSTCKGMYHSATTAVCPKCGKVLVYMTTKEGKPLSITECTFYPLFGKATMERWAQDTAKRKGGMGAVWRFKMVSYADKNGVLAEHPLSTSLKKGATIELRAYNHPPFFTEFHGKGGALMVEVLYVILTNYGDSIKVLKQPSTVVEKVGGPAPTLTTATAPQTVTPELVASITASVLTSLGVGTKPTALAIPLPAGATTPTAAPVVATSTDEDEIDEHLLATLYGDMGGTPADQDVSDMDASTLANVNPWGN